MTAVPASPSHPIPPIPDAVLMRRLAQRDSRALIELERRYGASLYAQVYGQVMDPKRAEQIVAQVFEYLWETSIFFDSQLGGPWNLMRRVARELARTPFGGPCR